MATRLVASCDDSFMGTGSVIVPLESQFKLNSNTQQYQPDSLYCLKLFAVYCGWEGLLGMRILEGTVNADRYCEILNELVVPLMHSDEHKHCLFQQDGVPPHYAIAREILDRELSDFPNRCRLFLYVNGEQFEAIKYAYGDEYDRSEWGIYEDLFANLTYKNESYNWRTRPGIYSGSPVVVNTSLYLYSMTSVNELHTEYTIQMLYRQSWIDPRLKFPDDFPVKRIVGDHWHFKRIWTPSVHVVNNKEISSLSTVSEGTVLVHIYRNGRVLTSNRVHMRPLCKMQFYRYPLDKQSCSLEIESSTFSPNHMMLQWDPDEPITLSEQFYLNGYYLTNVSTQAVISKYQRTGDFSKVIAHFQLKREFGHFLLDIYVPGVLFVVTSWTSFWVEIPAAPARVTLGITTMLTLITSEKSVREKLPKMSYVHALDIWNVVCTGFIFASLVEYAMVNYIYHKDKRRKQGGMKRVDSATTVSSVDTEISSAFSILSPFRATFRHDRQRKQLPDESTAISFQNLELGIKCPVTPEIGCNPCIKEKLRPQDIANGIDRKCRVIFPVGFILFNLVYWIVLWV